MIVFFAPGTPKGQPRPRAFARKFGAKWSARVYNPETADGWKSEIAVAAKEHRPSQPIEGPVELTLSFYLPRPKAHFKGSTLRPTAPYWCEKKPDADNYAKSVMDALTALQFWRDDAQVARLTVLKRYEQTTGCLIEIGKI